MATISEANNETMKAIPSGASNLPSMPERKNKGTKATMMINVALIMDVLISTDASKITSVLFFLSETGI